MQFHPTATDPTSSAILICRNGRWNLLVILAFLWLLPAAAWVASGPIWLVVLFAALAALLTWPLASVWRKRGRPENWVLALANDGLWLNLRDCEYHEAEPADSVVFVPHGEIDSARRFVHHYSMKHGTRTWHHKDVYLELHLRDRNTATLQQALTAEWQRQPPPRKYLWGHVTSHSRRTQAPISVESNGVVRVKFSVSNCGRWPAIQHVLALLGQSVPVTADHQPPAEDWQQLDDRAFDALVRRLAVNGRRIDAMNLLRDRNGLSLREAKQLVDHVSECTGRL